MRIGRIDSIAKLTEFSNLTESQCLMANSSSALTGIENNTQPQKGTALALTGIENDTQHQRGKATQTKNRPPPSWVSKTIPNKI